MITRRKLFGWFGAIGLGSFFKPEIKAETKKLPQVKLASISWDENYYEAMELGSLVPIGRYLSYPVEITVTGKYYVGGEEVKTGKWLERIKNGFELDENTLKELDRIIEPQHLPSGTVNITLNQQGKNG